MMYQGKIVLSCSLLCLAFASAAAAQTSTIDFDGPVTPGPTLNVAGVVGDSVTVYSVPATFTDCSSIPPIPAAGTQLQAMVGGVASPSVPLTSAKQSITLSAPLTAGQRLCLKSTNSGYNYSSPKPADVKAAPPAVSIVGNLAPGTTGVTVLATVPADIWVYSFPSSYKLANGASLCAASDIASAQAKKLPIGPRGADSFTVAAGAQSTFQLTSPIAASTQLCLEAKPAGADPFFSALAAVKAPPQSIVFNGLVSPGSSFSVTGQTGATISLYSIATSVACNKDVASHGTLLKFNPNGTDTFTLASATSDLTVSSPLTDGERLCLTATDAGAAPGAEPTEFATANVVGFIRFAETPVAGAESFIVEGDPGYPVSAYQFPAGFKPKSGTSCGPDDVSGANGQVTLLHLKAAEADAALDTIPLPNPTPPGVTSLVWVDNPLAAGTVLCLVEAGNSTVYSTPQTVAAATGVTEEPGFAKSFYTFGAVVSNQLGTSNSTSAAQYVDFGWTFHFLNEGLYKKGSDSKVGWPFGINTSFSGRFSTMPVTAQTTETQTNSPSNATSAAVPYNILTTQESARIMASFSIPFRAMKPVPYADQTKNPGSSAIFMAPVIRGSFSTLLNPSSTATTSTGTAPAVQYAPTYNDWSVGGRIGLRYYPTGTRSAHSPIDTVAQLDVTLGKFSNLLAEECGTTPTSTGNKTAPANTSCYQPVTASGKTTYNYLPLSRISIPRLELDGFYRVLPGPLVIGIDANLSQYSWFVPSKPYKLDTMNRAGSDVRIYFGVSGNLGDLCTQLKLCKAQ